MKASVARVLVLRPTSAAHREPTHGRVGPIVRNSLDDREAWSTVGAVDERIAIATVRLIEQFAQAIAASGDVRGNGNELLPARVTLDYLKVVIFERNKIFEALDRLDRREWWRI